MIEIPNLQSLASFAWRIRHLSEGEPEQARHALCWVARNRLQRLVRAQLQLLALAPEVAASKWASGSNFFCDVLRGVGGADADFGGGAALCRDPEFLADEEVLRSLAVVCQSWCGDIEDPTGGADMFHRHNETPAWAQNRTPTALIGSMLYYAS